MNFWLEVTSVANFKHDREVLDEDGWWFAGPDFGRIEAM